MKKNLHYFLLLTATAGIGLHAHAQSKLNKNNVNKVVTAKPLDKKAHSVAGVDTCFCLLLTAAKRDSSKSVVIEKVNKVIVPQQPVNETKPTVVNLTDPIEELNGFAIGM